MRATDEDIHPEALKRMDRTRTEVVAGLTIAVAGLVAVFWLKEVYIGFTVALIGAGFAPIKEWMKT